MTTLKTIPSNQLTINDCNAATQGNPTYDTLVNNYMISKKQTPVLIGDVISANGMTATVTKIEYIGAAYGLVIHTDNGQKINAKKLAQLIDQGLVKINN